MQELMYTVHITALLIIKANKSDSYKVRQMKP